MAYPISVLKFLSAKLSSRDTKPQMALTWIPNWGNWREKSQLHVHFDLGYWGVERGGRCVLTQANLPSISKALGTIAHTSLRAQPPALGALWMEPAQVAGAQASLLEAPTHPAQEQHRKAQACPPLRLGPATCQHAHAPAVPQSSQGPPHTHIMAPSMPGPIPT